MKQVWLSNNSSYTTRHTHTHSLFNTSPIPCHNLFGLLTLHSSVFSFILEHLAAVTSPESNTAGKEIVQLRLWQCLTHLDGSRGKWRWSHLKFLFPGFSSLQLLFFHSPDTSASDIFKHRAPCSSVHSHWSSPKHSPPHTSSHQLGRDSIQPWSPALRGPQIGSSWVADRLLQRVGQMESLEWPLPGNLALRGGVGAKGLGGADQQGPRLYRSLVRGRQAVSRTRPLCTVGGGGGVLDELGRLGLGWSGGGRGVAQGALAAGQRGSSGVCGEVCRASDAAGTQLAGSRELPAQTRWLDDLTRGKDSSLIWWQDFILSWNFIKNKACVKY